MRFAFRPIKSILKWPAHIGQLLAPWSLAAKLISLAVIVVAGLMVANFGVLDASLSNLNSATDSIVKSINQLRTRWLPVNLFALGSEVASDRVEMMQTMRYYAPVVILVLVGLVTWGLKWSKNGFWTVLLVLVIMTPLWSHTRDFYGQMGQQEASLTQSLASVVLKLGPPVAPAEQKAVGAEDLQIRQTTTRFADVFSTDPGEKGNIFKRLATAILRLLAALVAGLVLLVLTLVRMFTEWWILVMVIAALPALSAIALDRTRIVSVYWLKILCGVWLVSKLAVQLDFGLVLAAERLVEWSKSWVWNMAPMLLVMVMFGLVPVLFWLVHMAGHQTADWVKQSIVRIPKPSRLLRRVT